MKEFNVRKSSHKLVGAISLPSPPILVFYRGIISSSRFSLYSAGATVPPKGSSRLVSIRFLAVTGTSGKDPTGL
jgi:hypothetical protein